jgi:hypothetical protein
MDLDDVIPARTIRSAIPASPAPRSPLCGMLCTGLPCPLCPWGMRSRAARPACPAVRQEARAVGRPQLSRRHSHSGAVLRATPCRYLSRPQPGLAPAGRIGTAASGRGGPARLVRTWMDQGRDGISPRTGPGRNLAEHRDPRSRDGPEDQAGLRRVLVCHPAGQQRDSPRGTESRRTPRRVVSQGALTCGTRHR